MNRKGTFDEESGSAYSGRYKENRKTEMEDCVKRDLAGVGVQNESKGGGSGDGWWRQQ